MGNISKAERERRAAMAAEPSTKPEPVTEQDGQTPGSQLDFGTVAMCRDAAQFPPPHRADVHPAEVANYAAGGWRVA